MIPDPVQQADPRPGAAHPADAELMQRLARRDMAALAQLVRRHQTSVWNLAYRVMGRWDLADDVTQETFLRVLRSAESYKPAAALTTWLYRIVSNLCLDLLRKPRPATLPEDPVRARMPDAAGGMEQAERAAAVRDAVGALPERQRIALVLHRFHGQTHAQIARALDCSIPAVESLLVRAYAELRKRLKPWSQE